MAGYFYFFIFNSSVNSKLSATGLQTTGLFYTCTKEFGVCCNNRRKQERGVSQEMIPRSQYLELKKKLDNKKDVNDCLFSFLPTVLVKGFLFHPHCGVFPTPRDIRRLGQGMSKAITWDYTGAEVYQQSQSEKYTHQPVQSHKNAGGKNPIHFFF